MSNIQQIPPAFAPANDCLKNKIILVTGAGEGIGRCAALHFARHGATVILLGRTLAKLEEVYDAIEAEGYPAAALCPFDLKETDPAAYQKVAESLEKNFGRLDGLLHNAGILGSRNSIESYKPALWLEVMQVNLNGAFLLTRALMPLLRKSPQASLLFTSSGVGREGRGHWGAYSVSKFATEGLMQVLADEMENTSTVRVNSINPGATRTRMRAQAYPAENPQQLPAADSLMPAYLYLMSNASIGINGKSFDAR